MHKTGSQAGPTKPTRTGTAEVPRSLAGSTPTNTQTCTHTEAVNIFLPLSVLTLAAQIWEPIAVKRFLSHPHFQKYQDNALKAHQAMLEADTEGFRTLLDKKDTPSGSMLQAALTDTAAYMHSILAKPSRREGKEAMAHLEALAQGGACRTLGLISLGQRVGSLQKDPSGNLRLGKTREAFRATRGAPQQLQQLSRLLTAEWLQPWFEACGLAPSQATRRLSGPVHVLGRMVDIADKELRQLGSWSGIQGEYLRPHVLRKLTALAMEQPEAGLGSLKVVTGWPKTNTSFQIWKKLAPDSAGKFTNQMPSLSSQRHFWQVLSGLDPTCNPLLTPMWVCLWRQALQAVPGARAWVAEADKDSTTRAKVAEAFEAKRRSLVKGDACPPSPRDILGSLLGLAPSQAQQGHASEAQGS